MNLRLLTRDSFREGVFARDGNRCVVCGQQAQDAHHIMERRLWPDGGYYLANGASLCGLCHIKAEQTTITPQDLWERIRVKPIIPPHLYDDQPYDKWGNPILPNGTRLKGELFHDESVQKILAPILNVFVSYVKYSRTYHMHWSPGGTDDDRYHRNDVEWRGKRVIVTEKMDGENTTMYRDHIHARSVDSGSHPTRTWVKNYWAQIAHEIPEGWRVCGENLYAKHSIGYADLPSYFMGFSVWNEKNYCLPWDETLEIFGLLGVTPVRTLFDGIYDYEAITDIPFNSVRQEGYVVRIADGFSYGEFRKYVGKYVRLGHVQTTKHWMRGQAIERNACNA